MSVKKIFIILGTIVACVIVIAFALNVLMPNVVTAMVSTVEGMIYNATGLSFDFDGNGKVGQSFDGSVAADVNSDTDSVTGSVEGFNGAGTAS